MEPSLQVPRETVVPGNHGPVRRRSFDPTLLFAQRDRLPWFWFFIAVLVTVFSAWDRQRLVAHFKERERVVIIDPSDTYYLSPLLEFTEAKDLHADQAELAALAFLERNPRDFDHPELLKRMFLKGALSKALEDQQKEVQETRAKQLRQKPEIAKIEILATRENQVLASVSGQLIRTGVFQDKTFTEAMPFALKLNLARNPNLAANGRFPMAVSEFKYEIKR
ncbi:MAG: hypothetical protein JNK85_25690 [Verrucomicrobiales bacterium]|jgi:hypothetical protein|nr:hypothetical protein [Verrucomicrobiales bacterium]